jgi:cell division protein FtsX
MFIMIFGLAVLIACWWVGDLNVLTKIVFTLLYLASFGLLFIPNYSFLFIVAQCALVAVIGTATFGLDWLRKDPRR